MPNEGSVSVPQRLERSNANRVIAGVCGGIAEYLAVDPTLVRVVFVVLAFFGGIGLLAYIVLLILMPLPGRPAPFSSTPPPPASSNASVGSAGDHAARTGARAPVHPPIHAAEAGRRRLAAAYPIIAPGLACRWTNAGIARLVP